MTPTATATAVISRDELIELAELEKEYAEATAAVTNVEKAVKAARMALAEKVLGTETSKGLRTLDPDQVEKLMISRREKGLWRAARNAPPFVFLKTSSGRYPSWKAEFILLKSEAAAEKITAETEPVYSYRVDVAV